ncbi:MAG: hypothetical protein AB2541_01270 [Candidatus Thiodiazotropha sp.]
MLTKEGANALSQRGVFMKEPPESLKNSVNLEPESCSVHREGFEPRLSFRFDVRKCTLKFFDSVSNLLLNFGVVRFRQSLMFPGQVFFDFGFSIIDTGQLRQVVRDLSLLLLPFLAQQVLFWPG